MNAFPWWVNVLNEVQLHLNRTYREFVGTSMRLQAHFDRTRAQHAQEEKAVEPVAQPVSEFDEFDEKDFDVIRFFEKFWGGTEFGNRALRVLRIPVGNADIERGFSVFTRMMQDTSVSENLADEAKCKIHFLRWNKEIIAEGMKREANELV